MSDPRTAAALSPGTTVGGYRVGRTLGQGGVGTVYAAAEVETGRPVALKVLRRGLADDPAMLERFRREAAAASAVRHPGVVEVTAFGELDDGRPYLVMPLLEGRSLRDELEARGALPQAEAWRIARAVASALVAAHAAGIVHRDLKPDNVFLERGEGGEARPRLLDFGIAKLEVPTPGEPMKLTATGVPLGTPAYMAPEQWWGTGVGPRTDQYALGVVLHEMLRGRPPFESESFMDLAQQHVGREPPAVPGVPAPAQEVIARLLAKSPDDRFASMSEVIAAGDAAFCFSAEPEVAPAERPAPARASLRAFHRFVALHVALVALGLAALLAVGYAGYARHDPREWVRNGGWGQHVILLLFVGGLVGMVAVARRRAATGQPTLAGFWLALLPALQGAFTTYTGWLAIHRGLSSTGPLDLFTVFCLGTYEANSARFLGFAVAAILCLSLAALPGVSGMAGATVTLPRAPGVRPREASGAAVALLVMAVFAGIVGAPSAALVAGAAAVVLLVGLRLPTVHAETAARDELERAVAGVLAVVLAAAVGVTRIEAREAALWGEGLTRAARVAEIVAARGERDTTLPIAVVSLVVVAAVEVLRIRRLARLGALRRPRTATAALATVLALGGTGDLVLHGRFFGERDALRADLAAQFALFARLDPPAGDALPPARFPPHRATALQITRDVVAVNGRGVARLSALGSPDGAAQVATDLNRALAEAALGQGDPSGVELSVSVDSEVPGATLLGLLRVARRGGVRRAELLLTRGEPPRLAKGPPEIGVVVPGDFVALPAELGDEGAEIGDAGRFGAIAPALMARALGDGGTARIAVR